MREGTARAAVVGALASIGLSILPFSPLLGGGLAGFLSTDRARGGAAVGALSGLLLLVPAVPIVCLVALGLVMVGVVPLPGTGPVVLGLFLAILLSLVAGYTVGLSAVGGAVGAFLAADYPDRRAAARRRAGLEPSSSAGGDAEGRDRRWAAREESATANGGATAAREDRR